jgi:hypothetical protein
MANVTILPALLTRPNDTTLYTVGDGIAASAAAGALIELPLFSAAANGSAFLTGFQLITSQKACQAGVRVHFYNANTVSAAGKIFDNAVFTDLSADQQLYQGYIDLDAFNTEDTTSTFAVAFRDGMAKQMTADANKSLWFQLQLKTGAFTPDALQTFRGTAWGVQ